MSEPQNLWGSNEFTKSNVCLTARRDRAYTLRGKLKGVLKKINNYLRETTVEPCLFLYMLSIAISSLAVQNMHLEKSCRVNYAFGDEICDRIMARNTTELDEELKAVQSLVAKVVAWKFPLQTGIPAVMVLFIGAWSDKTKKRKICILFPMVGELVTNVGMILATYYLEEWSIETTALIEALPPALTGSYIIVFMGMYSYMADITTEKERTFRFGIVTMFVTLGTPTGTALSGILLRTIGYYGVFSLLIVFHLSSLTYGIFRLEDVVADRQEASGTDELARNKLVYNACKIWKPVFSTIMVALKERVNNGRLKIFLILILYFLMVGPLYGDSQVAYLYAIRKFSFTEVEYSVYGTVNVVLGLIGTLFCISILSKCLKVEDSAIGGLAAASRIVACFFFAFASTRILFYCAPLVNIFSHSGLPAIRSMATKRVANSEIAQLSSLMGVAEAFAPSVYMPVSSMIYATTIDRFPGAFYMFDAALTVLALSLFCYMYFLTCKERINAVTDSKKKGEFARSNEITSL